MNRGTYTDIAVSPFAQLLPQGQLLMRTDDTETGLLLTAETACLLVVAAVCGGCLVGTALMPGMAAAHLY